LGLAGADGEKFSAHAKRFTHIMQLQKGLSTTRQTNSSKLSPWIDKLALLHHHAKKLALAIQRFS
jgi:hypothetical protein